MVPRISGRTLYPQCCTIIHFYWVAEYAVDKRLLNADKYITKPFNLYSNVENQGCSSSLLLLLYCSTYSLNMNEKDLLRLLPSSDWIDSVIVAVERNAVHL